MTVLVVSVDGVAPRHISRASMPVLTTIASRGAGCFSAQTVRPTWTLPAHLSMVRGVDPRTHGVLDNTPEQPDGGAPSFLNVCRAAGLRTASITSWSPMEVLFEADAATTRIMFDDGYNPAIDNRVIDQTCTLLTEADHDVVFSYLVTPDLIGHDHGWDSEEYVACLTDVDALLGSIVACLGEQDSLLVTTDHGGLGHHHEEERPEDIRTFVAAMGPAIERGGFWAAASVLDIAPTACALAGVAPDPKWEGTSLLGRQVPFVDHLMGMLEAMENVFYGEDVTMLEHALQVATLAHADGEAFGLAGLLHDVGHLLSDAGPWGVAGHAVDGADFLQPWLPSSVVEPIRLHVDAKRWLVTRRPGYEQELSTASLETLALQGGPFTDAECALFEQQPGWLGSVALREYDDHGKDPKLTVAGLSEWRGPLARWLEPTAHGFSDASALRSLCICSDCVDPASGQRMSSGRTESRWCVDGAPADASAAIPMCAIAADGTTVRHDVILPGDRTSASLPDEAVRPVAHDDLWISWSADDRTRDTAAQLLCAGGAVVLRGVGVEPETVLDIARSFGHVRATNYGELFDVVTKPDPENLAYSSRALGLHTDNPYRDPCPSVQLLHCLVPDADGGGASLVSDGIAAANQLREVAPDAFRLLAETPIRFEFRSADVHLEAVRPVIEMTPWGDVRAVNVNDRSMRLDAAASRSARFGVAMDHFTSIVNDHAVNFALDAGDLLMMDNRRVLHGRTGFTRPGRHLQGCYIDIDAVRSVASMAST